MAETLEKIKAALHCIQDGATGEETAACNCDGMDPSGMDSIWQIYYDSQYCPERKNLAVFKKNMPRRDQEAAGLRLMQNRRNATLDDYIENKKPNENAPERN
jgi:hypothetical protein